MTTFLTGKHLSRRAALRGIGASLGLSSLGLPSLGLPWLDAMIPAGKRSPRARPGGPDDPTRFVAIEMVHGAAGSNKLGASKYLWAPQATGRDFDLGPSSLSPLEPYRDSLTIVSNTDVRGAEATSPRELGGDHFRSSAVFLTQSHPRQTEGSDIEAGTSMDQLYASRFGQKTPIPSMQLCIENVDQSGGCAYGYACVYTDSISWSSPTDPMPMIRDPRLVFDQLFGSGGTAEQRAARRRTDRSILDWVVGEVGRLKQDLGAGDRGRLDDWLEDVREVERRIQRAESRTAEGEATELPTAPTGVPGSYDEHVKLMFDLMVLAFESDMTRIFSLKMGRDGSARVFPESGVKSGFHPASHHGGREARVTDFAKINRYHVSLVAYFLDRLKNTVVGESSLLQQSLVLYGSPMGDSNLHNHKRCPLFLAGHANGQIEGHRHVKAPDGSPMADVMLECLQKLGCHDIARFGDSSVPA